MAVAKTVAKVGGIVAVALITYRGLCLYLRNDVTISITELVRLPPATLTAAAGRRRHADTTAVTIKGKVEVETRVMRSYRFMLRLAGIVKNEAPTAVAASAYSMPGSPRAGGSFAVGVGASNAGSAVARNRVMASFPSRTAEGSGFFSNGSNDNNSCSLVQEDSVGFEQLGSRRHNSHGGLQPTILVKNTNEMVDVCEIDLSGHVYFTPSCVMEDTLLTYVAAPTPALLSSFDDAAKASAGSRAHSAILSAALTGGADGCGNVTVRSCYLQADDSATNGMKLSLEVEVSNPVHGLQLLIRLPHRRCRFLRAQTDGVGSVRQPMKASKPHRLVWDIGTVDQTRSNEANEVRKRKHKKSRKNKKSSHAVRDAAEPQAGNGNDEAHRVEVLEDDDEEVPVEVAGAAAPSVEEMRGTPAASDLRDEILCDPAFGARLLIAHCTIVFEQPTDIFYGEKSNSSSSDAGGVDDVAEKDTAAEEEEDEVNDDELFASAGNRAGDGLQSAPLSQRRKGGGGSPSPAKGRARGIASAPNQSHKSARREAKKQQRREEKQKQRADAVLAGRGASTQLPTVEITYSTSGLASGMSVKKLQVVSDKPNWVARSPLDRYVLKPLLRGLADMKLKRFAHYTTWFVQPVPVSTLAL